MGEYQREKVGRREIENKGERVMESDKK